MFTEDDMYPPTPEAEERCPLLRRDATARHYLAMSRLWSSA